MVFFTCNFCGTALKKNQVEKHFFQCRCTIVSCIDCNKDFSRVTYKSHTQCISEDQKYGGQSYQPKENSMKGKVKQERWIELVKQAVKEANVSKELKIFMDRLIEFDNIPRKKNKFFNFVKNCLRISSEHKIETLWNIFDSASLKLSSEKQNPDQQEQNESDKRPLECQTSPNISKKFKTDAIETSNGVLESSEKNEESFKFKYTKVAKRILRNSEDGMKLKHLKRHVWSEYESLQLKDSLSKSEVYRKLDTKLAKSSKFKSDGKKIYLC